MFYLIAISHETGLTPDQFIDNLYNSDEIQCEHFECHGWNDFIYFKTINKKITGVTSLRYKGQEVLIQQVPKFKANGSTSYDINSLIGSICRFIGVIAQHSGETNPATFYCPLTVAPLLLRSKIEDYSFVQVDDGQNNEFFFSVSKSFPTTPDAITSALKNQEDIDDAVHISDSYLDTLSDWFFKSNNPQIQDVESIKIARKAITIVNLDKLPTPPLPPPPVALKSPEIEPNNSRQFFVEIFHDAENCPCIGIKPTGTYQNVIRRVLLALLNGDQAAADAVDLTSSVDVKWNFVISPDRMNNYNRPSEKFRNEMASVYGGIWIDPGQKPDAVDTKIKELLSKYQRSYASLSPQDKMNRVVLLISGDKDFSLSIQLLRQTGYQVMVIYNHKKTSEAFLSLFLENFRLGLWSDLAEPMKQIAEPNVQLPTPAPMIPSTNLNYVYDVAGYVLSKDNAMPGSHIVGLYNEKPNIKATVDQCGGLNKFCELSGGVLHSVGHPSTVSVCIWNLVRVFVVNRSGHIPASQLGELYGNLGKVGGPVLQKLIKSAGKFKGLCPSLSCTTSTCSHIPGALRFEWVDDQSVGYGYLNASSDVSAIPDNNPTNQSNTLMLPLHLAPYQYWYARTYLQDVMNQIVLDISPNVVLIFKSSSTIPRPEFQLCYTPADEANSPTNAEQEDPMSVLQNCKKVLLDIINGTSSDTDDRLPKKIIASEARVVSVSKESLLGDQNLKDLRESWLIGWSVRAAGTDSNDDENMKDLIMKIPKKWLKDANEIRMIVPNIVGGKGMEGRGKVEGRGKGMEGRGKGRGGRGKGGYDAKQGRGGGKGGGGGRGKFQGKNDAPMRTVADILIEMIQQHLSNYFSLGVHSYKITLSLDQIIPHAELSFKKESDRNRILSSNLSVSTRTGATFHKTLSSQDGDDSEVVPSSSIILYYQSGSENQVDEYWNEVLKLQRTKSVVDVFPQHKISLSHRPLIEQYFFNDHSWGHFQNEVEAMCPSVILTLEQNEMGKNVIQLSGLKVEVDIASQYLIDRASNLLERTLKIPKKVQSEKLHHVLSKTLKFLARNFKSKSDVATPTTDADDQTSIDDSVVQRAGYYATTYFIGKTHITIVGTPEIRVLWQSQIDACQDLLHNFTEQRRVPVQGVRVDVKEITKKFKLSECFYEKSSGSVVLSGLSDRVENAVSFIELKIKGENGRIINIGCNESDYSWCYDRLVKYFSLPGPSSLLAAFRDSLKDRFGGQVTAAISLNEVDGNLLMVQCPDRIAHDVEQQVREMLRVFIASLISLPMPLTKGEVEWLRQSNIVEDNTLVDFVTSDPDDDDDDENYEKNILCQCSFNSISLSVLHTPNRPSCLDGCEPLNEGRPFFSKTQLKGSIGYANDGYESTIVVPVISGNEFDSIEAAARETILSISEWIGNEPNPNIANILLYDHDVTMVHALTQALQDLSEGHLSPSTVTAPNAFPRPTHQWYRRLWDWEVANNASLATTLEVSMPDGRVCVYKVCPYDYDQVVQLEYAYDDGRGNDIRLVGDVNGVQNQKSYIVSFKNMTQTTDPIFNQYSTRQIFRLPISPGEECKIPLFNERLESYNAAVRAYEAQERARPMLRPALPSKPQTSTSQIPYGVILFGTDEAVETTKNRLQEFIQQNKKIDMIKLELLSRYGNFSFDNIYLEVVDELSKIGVTVSRSNVDWEVRIECMGLLALLEAKNTALNFEKRLLANTLKTPYPESWGYGDIDGFDIEPTTVELGVGDPEYETAKECFLQKGFTATIRRIERVQNAELYEKYYKRKCEVARLNGGDANEMLLKHGTKMTPPSTIWQSSPSKTNTYAFDFRYASDTNFYGRGSYFTDDASYVDGSSGLSGCYSHKLENGDKQMFLALVAVGRSEVFTAPKRDIKTPSSGYQSVKGPITTAHQGIVVYELSQCYPMYVVTYAK